MSEPLASISCITFNHVKYIRDALNGFLMQKTNFPIEILIHDDASTDGTEEIIREYEGKYPEIIKSLYEKENQWVKGRRGSAIFNFPRTKGKYIAMCEGDDYWIDPLKLQKQVDFLEANPEFSLCFHDALILWEDKSTPPKYFCSKDQKEVATVEDVIEKWFIPSASMVFRKENIMPLPGWFKDIYNGDWALQLLLSVKGKIGYIDKVMSIYRRNQGSLSVRIGKNAEFVNNQMIELLNYFNEHSNFRYNIFISKKIKSLHLSTKAYKLRKKSKFLYWLFNPLKLANKISEKMKN